MKVFNIKKGEKAVLPNIVIANRGVHDGAPSDGIKITLNPIESFGGCIFVPAKLLAGAGYLSPLNINRTAQMVELFYKSELVEIAERLKLKSTGDKKDLAQRILRVL